MGRAWWAIVGGASLGVLTSVLGFFLPIVLAPEANQGPLLGCCLAPFGTLVGAVLGALAAGRIDRVHAARRPRREARE